ncbi:Frequency clock protein [Hirsutella minnesotensis 3608]|nr:Frequency clock protein [Hirsutella minnesotensis 3608]
MPLPARTSHGTQQQPQPSATGHPLPRRTSPANSVTLRHHRLARDVSLRASPGSGPANSSALTSSPRRNSSGESQETGHSDPKKWFDQSNQNPTATFDNSVMDVDPPFFQKESDSSNEDKSYPYQHPAIPPRLVAAQSSSADDYRSVIDDLTVEIQKLKEELKRYKQKGPDMLRKDKLFEIKIHGLPKRKKRELETTLRDFAAGLQDSPDASSSQRKKSSRHATRDHMYSASGSVSKHASSSSGSNARPADSAYASMSTGAHSSGTSLGRPTMSSRARSSEQKVENYLRDIPEGLYPRHMAMTEREKKKLVVRRLEQLFTGKISGRSVRRNQWCPPATGTGVLGPVIPEGQPPQRQQVHQPPALAPTEPAREARILPPEQQSGQSGKKSRSRDNGSASHSNGDQTESGGNGNSSGSGTNPSPNNMPAQPEQRPTRVKDLDPDRVQVPSENMEYIRHLGLVPPELLVDATQPTPDVHPDAEGWVYLNLLCNLAQLHMINVTPGFVRSAVSGISAKFQLSPDGRKIRWRGGSEGTKFSSDSSGDASQRSADTDDTTSSNKEESRKRQKTGNSTGDDFQSGSSSNKNPSKFGPQVSGSSESFHYKPLFVQQESPNGQMSFDDTLSSFGPVEDSNVGDSRWGLSGSGTSNRRKRRHDGAIIYYSGAPFCTDLSGDHGDLSPATYMLSSGQDRQEPPSQFSRPYLRRSESGSCLAYRPLSDGPTAAASFKTGAEISDGMPGLTSDSEDSADDIDCDLTWSNRQQFMEVQSLEPCGLGGVLPDDHFMVVVSTKRPKFENPMRPQSAGRLGVEESTESIVNRLATMSTSSPVPVLSRSGSQGIAHAIEVEYVSGRIKRLVPVPLPPPAIFLPPFSTDSSSDGDFDAGFEGDDDDEDSSEEQTSQKANPHHSDGYPDGVDLTSGDEDGEDPENEPDTRRMYDVDIRKKASHDFDDYAPQSIGSAEAAPGTLRGRSKSVSEVMARTGGSSAATAGGVESGYSSSVEESS